MALKETRLEYEEGAPCTAIREGKLKRKALQVRNTFLMINVTILEPEILGNHNINTGTTLLLKTIVN